MTLAIAIVGAAWAPAALGAVGATSEPRRVSSHAYVVRAGDTLWSIAERLAPGEDPRPVVDAIASVNVVDAGRLIPGQTLLIPSDA